LGHRPSDLLLRPPSMRGLLVETLSMALFSSVALFFCPFFLFSGRGRLTMKGSEPPGISVSAFRALISQRDLE